MGSHPAQIEGQSEPARIGRWIIPAIPAEWVWLPGFGIQKQMQGVFPSNIHLREDQIEAEELLGTYIEKQMKLIQAMYTQVKCAGPAPFEVTDGLEGALLILKHAPMAPGIVIQVQRYIRCAEWVGIATLTTIGPELPVVRNDFERWMSLVQIAQETAETAGNKQS